MKVYITATSSERNYPGVCGVHEFDTLEGAVDFARYGAEAFKKKAGNELVLIMDSSRYKWYEDADIIIEIYDDYRE